MHFVPIPTTLQYVTATSEHWLPFIPGISRGSKEPINSILGRIARCEVQIALVWDGKQAHAIVGIQFVRRGEELIGEIIWLSGKGMRKWRHLLPELEQYLRDMGCKVSRPICRPGWSRFIEPQGYRTTHYVMEKVL